jgi:hypothetical protein
MTGVRISYDVAGEGWPLVLLHGWCCDRSWWTEPGYVEELRRDRLPRRGRPPRSRCERQASRGRRAPERVSAMVSSGSWDPRPLHEEPTDTDEWDEAVRNGGTRALVDLFKNEDGAAGRVAVQQARGFSTVAPQVWR